MQPMKRAGSNSHNFLLLHVTESEMPNGATPPFGSSYPEVAFAMIRRSLATVLAAGLFGAACTSSRPPMQELRAAVLQQVPAAIILPTYRQLDARTAALVERIDGLVARPTDAELALARSAWQDARRSWEQGEGFLFGPVDTEGLDPRIDTWPVNRTDLDAVLAGKDPLTVETVSRLDVTLQGFHTLEYLLWGTGGKTAA